MLPEMSLQGRTAIVTGASRGIGRAIALVLAEAGADAALVSRSEPDLKAAADEIQAMGRRTLIVPTDVSDSAQVDRMVVQAIDFFGKVDILVNNAGQFMRNPVVPLPGATLQPPHVTRDSSTRITDEE